MKKRGEKETKGSNSALLTVCEFRLSPGNGVHSSVVKVATPFNSTPYANQQSRHPTM